MFKTQILAALVQKYPGMSKVFLGLIADNIAKKVTEESAIQGSIDELDNSPIPIADLEKSFQTDGDRRVTEAEKKWKLKNPTKPTDKTDEPDDKTDSDEPEWAKKIRLELADLKKEKLHGSMLEKAKLKLKEVPEVFWEGRALPEKDEDLETFVTDVTKKYTDFKQDQINKGLMVETAPGGGDGAGKATGKEAADIEKWATAENPKAEAKK